MKERVLHKRYRSKNCTNRYWPLAQATYRGNQHNHDQLTKYHAHSMDLEQ